MKKLFFAALLAVSLTSSAFAAEITTSISSKAVESFQVDFKDASHISWTTVGELAKVSFINNEERVEAFYNNDGEMVGFAKAITVESLPVNAKRTFAKKYVGYTVNEAIKFEGTEDTAFYIAASNDKESIVLKVTEQNQVSLVKRTTK